MKDEIWQRRQFLLSSFSRRKINITTNIYRFIDKIIREEWKYPLDINELDNFLFDEYQRYLNGQG
jgi:hypothetical protein